MGISLAPESLRSKCLPEGEAYAWIHDFHDAAWHTRAVRAALEAYAGWAGEPARRFGSAAAFLTKRIVQEMESGGVELDLIPEPAASWGLRVAPRKHEAE